MKKYILFFCACVFAFTSSAQEWPTVKIDSAVSVQLPEGFEKKETNNRVHYLANSGFGTIMIFKAEDNPRTLPDIEKDRHLERFYKDYVKSINKSSAGGSIINEKTTLLGDLKVKDFTLQVDSGSGKQYREFKILHANGATYTFEFLYDYLHEKLAVPEKDMFFKSIKVNEAINRADQYTLSNTEGTQRINPLWFAGGGAILLALIVLIIWKRKQA